MYFKIEQYSYTTKALFKSYNGGGLDLDVSEYQDLSFREFVLMRKSMALYQRLQKSEGGAPAGITPAHQAKAKAAMPAGARWITVHPNGKDDKGVPVMIQDHGDGTAHVVGGAGGRLNMLKLNNVKSKEEYKQLARERRDAEKVEREAQKKEKAMERAKLDPSDLKALRAQEKLVKQKEKDAETERKERIKAAKTGFLSLMANKLGWEDQTDAIYAEYDSYRSEAKSELVNAIDSEDKERIKKAKKDLAIIDKGLDQALKSYESNLMQAAKGIVKDIEFEAVEDESIRVALEERIGGKTEAEEVIRTEKKNQGKGFATQYAESAKEKGELTSEILAEEKEEVLQETLARIAVDSPQAAAMIAAGINTRRAVGAVKRELYERERLEGVVTDLDDKAEVLKSWIAYKKVLKEEEERNKAKQLDLEGKPVEEKESTEEKKITYGDGLSMDTEVSSGDFSKELDIAAANLKTERQAAANGSLLDSIEKNKDGSGKWLANGHYEGFNRLSLTVLKSESIPRDVVDVLGLRAGAQLLSKIMRDSMDEQAFKDAAEAIQRFHGDTSDDEARQANEAAEELFKKADGTLAEINALKASDPDDLSALKRLNDVRMGYLDEANRVLGQTLGNLEAVSMMGSVMKKGGAIETLETNLGTISTEAAIVRLRALGLTSDDYHIESVNGDRIATIEKSGVDKLTKSVDPEELALDRDVEDIKRGVYDEDNWLPAGLVDRPVDSFEDPGVDPNIPEGEVDNQSLGEDAVQIKSAQEAAHRALGQLPEGSIAFKAMNDLTPQDQTDLRRYWESSIYTGSVAEKESVRKYQGEKGVTRAGAWQSFIAQNGGAESGAYEGIKADISKRAPEDMFGNKETPPLLQIDPDNIDTYRDSKGVTRLNGAAEIFQEIDDLESAIAEGRITESVERAERELSSKKAALPEKLKDLYRTQLQDHYHAFMSGHSESDYASAEAAGRYEGSPWNEYVRMHGGPERAHAAVLDTIKGRFIEKFADQYGRVTKKPLGTKKERISEHKGHLLGMMGKEARDSIINKVQAELSSAGAAVANRAGGKFASGSWREKAIELIEKRRADDAAQGSFFDEAELKQADGTERLSIGKRAEEQLASMLPELSQNQLRGQKFAVSTMQAKGERQRAIKMFERAKRMNLTFGTGKGKTIISIGAFTELHSKGKAKRAIFAVPSVVQKQFGNEVNVFCEPGKYKVKSDPSLDREGRMEAMRNPGHDMVVLTHQSLRDDMIHLMSKKMGVDEEAAKVKFNSMAAPERKAFLGETLKENGINFDMMTVDESHYTVNRKGKEDSTMANVMDALNQNVPYFMNQSATPVKNDTSEAFDFLKKVAPDKFTDRNEFMKRYGVDSEFSRESLRRLIARYNYSSPTNTGVKRNTTKETIQLTPAQSAAYQEADDAFRRASRAERAGDVDVEAVKILSPNSFKGKPESEHEEIAKRIQGFAGAIKEEAFNRIVNAFDPENNAKINRLTELVESKRYDADNEKNVTKKGDRAPGVVFAHNIASVEAVRAAMEKKGLRVGVIHGAMTGDKKDEVKNGFNPPNKKDRKYDLIVLSDAGATGLNLQNAKYLVNYDLPQTSWVKEQREGRIDRHGQAHDEIDYHDLVSDTEHESKKWNRVQRKSRLGSIFQQDPGAIDDTGLSAYLSKIRQERINQGVA